MSQFITIEDSEGTTTIINKSHVIKVIQTDEGESSLLFLTNEQKLYTKQHIGNVFQMLDKT